MLGEEDPPRKGSTPNNPIEIGEIKLTKNVSDSKLSFMGIQSLSAYHGSQDRLAFGIRNSKAALATEKFERNLAFTMGTFLMGGSNLAASAGWATLDAVVDYQSEETKSKIGKVKLAAILLVIARKGNGLQNLVDDIVAINKTTNGGGVLLNGSPSSAISSAMYYETAAEQSASIFKSISHGHMFMDGNKRTAVAVFEKLAKEAGIETVGRKDMLNVATQVAEGKVTDVSEIARLLTK
ncbi:Fic family protein [Chryseobacterium gallinarum]|uniref:Fic family protein n=1 Tax=Chryseobacterium gallinarum TaxID=1324352 RepID=UPI002024D1DD|nr:Fic family protein [Chryseobacterium gallinarum]MCL8535487.1 Fic family protein [Chryseobacterium gallinarum]